MDRVQRLAIAILGISFALRLFLVSLAEPVLFSDARDYYVLARNLLQNHEYAQTYWGETAAFEGFTFRAFRPPGYPACLATLFAIFGPRAHVGTFANIVFDLMTQIAFFLIAQRLFGPRSALLVLALLATHIAWTPMLISESFYTAIFSLLAVGVVFNWSATRGGAIACGALAAIGMFTRPITACFLPLTATRSFRKREWSSLALMWLPCVVGLACWALRNYLIFGRFVLLSTNLGLHNARDFGIDHDQVFQALRESGADEATIDSFILALEKRIAITRGLTWSLGLWLRHMAGLFSLRPSAELWLWMWQVGAENGFVPVVVDHLHEFAYWQYYAVYPVAAAGAAIAVVRGSRLAGMWGLAISYIALHGLISRGDVRLFAPLYPIACLMVASLLAHAPPDREAAPRPVAIGADD